MRINSVTAHAFGPLTGDTLKLAPGMTVVVGDNESAKTSWHTAIYSALCGRARRKGRMDAKDQSFADRHKPWDGTAWEVSGRLTLDDGREIEMRHDLVGNVDCSAMDLQLARDVSNEIMEDGSPAAAAWLGLDRRSFIATACINQSQLLGILDEADGMQKILQRASSTAGVDATAAEALDRLDSFQRTSVGRDDARSNRPLRQAVLALEASTAALISARAEHAEYLGAVEDVERLRETASRAQRDLALHEAAVARKVADEYARRLERAMVLRVQLGESPPPALTQTDTLGIRVARAIEAWEKRPRPSILTGPSADELRERISALPEVPSGDLSVAAEVRTAHDELARVKAALGAQADAAPAAPDIATTAFSQDEILSLTHALERGIPAETGVHASAIKDAKARVDGLGARARQARSLMLAGGVLVLLGAVLAVALSPVLAVAAVVGIVLIVSGLVKQKGGDLKAAREEHSSLSIQVAAAQESANQFARERAQAEVRCKELGVQADPAVLRTLATDIARAETFAERSHLFEERTSELTSEYDAAQVALRSALSARLDSADDDPESAYAAYVTACERRAGLVALAARRPALEEQLVERVRAEEVASEQAGALIEAERQLNEALVACGLSATTAQEALAELEAWEQRRQTELEARDTVRLEWSELESLLAGRTFDELTKSYEVSAADAAVRAGGFAQSEVESLAAGDPAAYLDELRQRASTAGEAAASGEGALRERAKDLASVSEAEEAEDNVIEQLRWLQSLDGTLSTTQRFLSEAQVRVQRDLAPILAANLAEWLPTITGGRYIDAIIDIETLEVRVCGKDRRWRSAKRLSQGTAEQVYLLLRAALARHLTTGKETCPLLLDDVTVQADATRTVAILELLHELSKEQQVIVFAQERSVAEWARENLFTPEDALVELPVIVST
jgi:DNA repair protein SbcC/Rad50